MSGLRRQRKYRHHSIKFEMMEEEDIGIVTCPSGNPCPRLPHCRLVSKVYLEDNTGFNITANEQLTYNTWLAGQVRAVSLPMCFIRAARFANIQLGGYILHFLCLRCS